MTSTASGQAVRFDESKMRMVVKVDGQQQPVLLRCRNLRLIPATRAAPWLAKYSRSDLQRYEVSLRVGGEQGRANTMKDVERAIVTLSRAVQLVSEDPRAYGMRAAAHRKLSVFQLETQDAAANKWPELACKAALEAFKSSYTCLLMSQEDTAEWSLAAIELHDAWRWLLQTLGVARRTIGLDEEQQPKLWEALSPFTECCPWQFEWIAERVTLLSPRNYEAWAMRGDAVRGIGVATVAKEFYVRAAELCETDEVSLTLAASYREKAAECDREFHGHIEATNEKLNENLRLMGLIE